jgi:hypothetical protein
MVVGSTGEQVIVRVDQVLTVHHRQRLNHIAQGLQ